MLIKHIQLYMWIRFLNNYFVTAANKHYKTSNVSKLLLITS